MYFAAKRRYINTLPFLSFTYTKARLGQYAQEIGASARDTRFSDNNVMCLPVYTVAS